MRVIGTAGHVDHGKSTLVRALTGIDPDRLREEKERGLTIDLGFAWLTLPSGREVSIVDVPGHERFIKNMLAGAGGVDLALLVIAADEGPMPQTREHLAILDLLDVPAGIVVLAKSDLVDGEYLDLVEEEIASTLEGSCLAGAPIVRVSATTGAGLDALKEAIDGAVDRLPPKRDTGRPRLPIDRAFTIQGFGTVVTGTLVDGAVETGDEVEIQPGRLRGRIRGLQRHRTKVGRLEPGTRAAVNLSGIHVESLSRGMVLARPGTLSDVFAVDVRLRATRILEHIVHNDTGVTFLSATSESEGRLRLLDRDDLGPGDSCWAQVVLDSTVSVARGDHCVLRTPNETIGGGIIVAINPRRHRRNHAPTLEALQRQLEGSPAERLLDLLLRGPLRADAAATALDLDLATLDAATTELQQAGTLLLVDGRLAATAWLDAAAGRLAEAVRAFLAENRLRLSVPREHARSAAAIGPEFFAVVLNAALERGLVAERDGALTLPGYEVTLTPAEANAVERYLHALRAGRFSPPTDQPVAPSLLAFLQESGQVVVMGDGVVFASEAYNELEMRIREHLATHEQVTLAEARDLAGTTRKYAQAFLEHLDAKRVTRRVGDARVLR